MKTASEIVSINFLKFNCIFKRYEIEVNKWNTIPSRLPWPRRPFQVEPSAVECYSLEYTPTMDKSVKLNLD